MYKILSCMHIMTKRNDALPPSRLNFVKFNFLISFLLIFILFNQAYSHSILQHFHSSFAGPCPFAIRQPYETAKMLWKCYESVPDLTCGNDYELIEE